MGDSTTAMLLQESVRPTLVMTTWKLPFIMRLSPEARGPFGSSHRVAGQQGGGERAQRNAAVRSSMPSGLVSGVMRPRLEPLCVVRLSYSRGWGAGLTGPECTERPY
jgi:hypothetical protein